MSNGETLQYVLELGADTPDRGRVCTLEVGPFPSETAAAAWADSAGNVRVVELAAQAEREGLAADLTGDTPDDDYLPIVGATLNVYTDRWGTDHDLTRDLY